MKNKLLIGTSIAMAMSLSHAFETPQTVDGAASGHMLVAQADTKSDAKPDAVLKGVGSNDGQDKQAAGAQSGDKKPQADANKVDRVFAENAIEANAREIQLSEMASEKATSDAVKDYAKRMVADHSTANEKLMSVINATIPEQWRPKKEANQKKLNEVKALKNLSGEKFDRQYIAMMVKEHKQSVDLYQKQAKSGKTEELKAFAKETLPTLQEHLKMAQDVAQKTGASASKAK